MNLSATTYQPGPAPQGFSPDDRETNEARAWFRRRLYWERRLAELRSQAERDRGVPTATWDRRAATGAP